MNDVRQLDAYRFFEREWDSYEQLSEEFEWERPDRFNIATYALDRWATDRGRVAIFAEEGTGRERTFTYWQLQNAANRLANYLADQGVGRGDRIGVNTPQKPETAIAHFAAWKLGAVSVPLSTLFGTDGLQYRLEDSGATACIVDESNVETLRAVRSSLPALSTVLTVDEPSPRDDERDLWDAIGNYSREFETVETAPDDDAIILYTSGTTGAPKGVLHGHDLLLGHLPGFVTMVCNMRIDDDTFWIPAEWSWVASLFATVFPTLFYGRPLMAYHDDGPLEPEDIFSMIDKYGLSCCFIPPTALRMMQQVEDPADRYALDSVRVITSGGESLGASLVDWLADIFEGAAVHEAYGQTEANLIVGDCTALTEFRPGKMGRQIPGHTIEILDAETREPVEPGTIGEIALRYEGDPVCFSEYYNEPEKTATKVQDGWLLTEDLGTRDEDGYIEFVGRADDVIICSGYRIGPEEIEDCLADHDAVVDAGIVGVPDDVRGEVPKAFVVVSNGHRESAALVDELQEKVQSELAKYEYPREIEFIDELPTTSTGKIQRTVLRQREDAIDE